MIERWRREGVALNPPASDEQISALSSALGGIPEDLERFLRLANGMPDGVCDAHLVAIWSSDEILHEHQQESGSDDVGPYIDWVFGDVLIDSQLLAVRLRSGRPATYVVEGCFEAPSLDAFLRAYLNDPSVFGAH
ncbi:MAG TPA: SMI1/KNR4 family protein [Myxococcota bacterium]|nr:SMI1/KNR4 family protein [Myxococcota bacterium]